MGNWARKCDRYWDVGTGMDLGQELPIQIGMELEMETDRTYVGINETRDRILLAMLDIIQDTNWGRKCDKGID